MYNLRPKVRFIKHILKYFIQTSQKKKKKISRFTDSIYFPLKTISIFCRQKNLCKIISLQFQLSAESIKPAFPSLTKDQMVPQQQQTKWTTAITTWLNSHSQKTCRAMRMIFAYSMRGFRLNARSSQFRTTFNDLAPVTLVQWSLVLKKK